MTPEDLKRRTKQFAIRIIRLVERLPETKTSKIIGNQLLRSGTSIAANYRAGCLGKSKRDFISKMKIVEEEADETLFWLELIEETGAFQKEKLIPLQTEAKEILLIIVASIKTAKNNSQ